MQRVRDAHVDVDGTVVAAIRHGLLALVGVAADDTVDDRDYLVRKIAEMRVFDDANGVMNLSLRDVDGDVLAVSQFTLYASTRKGNRPSWSRAAPLDVAKPAFGAFVAALSQCLGKPVPCGIFGAHMLVHLVNDGPVTIALDSRGRD